MNKIGVHLHGPTQEPDALYSVGFGCYTILDIDVEHYIADLLHHTDQPLILLRTYHPNVLSINPQTWAEHGARELARWAPAITHITPGNELNLASEGGGPTQADLARADKWLQDWSYYMRRLCPWASLHWPALSPPTWLDEAAALETMRTSITMFDVIDVHCYWQPSNTGITPLTEMAAFLRYDRIHRILSDRQLFISEFNRIFGPDDDKVAQEYRFFYEKVQQDPYVIGATSFVWSSPDPGFAQFSWVNNPRIAEAIRAIPKTTHQEGDPMPDGAPINVPQNIELAIVRYANQVNLPPELIGAICYQESGFNPEAIGDNGHSVGLMQLHDQGAGAGLTTAQRMDIETNLRVGTTYLKHVVVATESLEGGISAYNQGLGGWQAHGTQANSSYVNAVLTIMARFTRDGTFADPTADTPKPLPRQDSEEIGGHTIAFAFLKEYNRRGRVDGDPNGKAAYCGDNCIQSFKSGAVFVWAGGHIHILEETV